MSPGSRPVAILPDASSSAPCPFGSRLSSPNMTDSTVSAELRRPPPWSELPPELLSAISTLLTRIPDYVSFRSVCSPWRAAAPPHHLPPQFPCVTLPYMITDGISGFFSLSDNKTYRLDLPETRGCRCFGSSHGWLLLFDGSPSVFLLNPLTRAQIHLPPVTTFPSVVDFRPNNTGKEYLLHDRHGRNYTRSLVYMRDCTVKKAVLSADPASNSSCVVMVVFRFRNKLAFCRVGDDSWTEIDFGEIESLEHPIDAWFYKGRIYVLFPCGRLAACDPGPSGMIVLVPSSVKIPFSGELSLAELNGELHVLTCQFGVYALDLVRMKVVPKESIGSKMLFVGDTQTLAVSADDFPSKKGDCMYCTHFSYARGSCVVGVMCLEDGRMEWPFQLGTFRPRLLKHIWFTPSLGTT